MERILEKSSTLPTTVKIPIAEFRKKCKESFAYFAAFGSDVGDNYRPDGTPIDFFDDFHIDVCLFLQFAGPRKVLVIPRGFLKSHIGACKYPAWKSIIWPEHRTLIGGNTQFNAANRVKEILPIFEDRVIQAAFPEVIPDNFNKTPWSGERADLKRKGTYADGTFSSAGLGTKITGQHKNLIIEDDTSCPETSDLRIENVMPSREDIEKALGWHKLTYPLLIDPLYDESVIITTRWCFYDLVDYVEKNEKEYVFFERPAEDGHFENILYPKRFPAKVLREMLNRMGTYLYNALYRNDPHPLEDMAFNPSWTNYYDEDIPCEGNIIVTLDPIPPESGKGFGKDNAAIMACLHPTEIGYRGRIYVLDYYYSRYSVPEQINRAIGMAQRYGARRIKVESNFFQYEMVVRLRDRCAEEQMYIAIDEVRNHANTTKDMRILGLTPLFENGLIYIRRNMKELENEMYQFVPGQTRFARDDLLDALAMQLDEKRIVDKPRPKEEEKMGFSFESIMEELAKKRNRKDMRYGMPSQTQPYNPYIVGLD